MSEKEANNYTKGKVVPIFVYETKVVCDYCHQVKMIPGYVDQDEEFDCDTCRKKKIMHVKIWFDSAGEEYYPEKL